MIIKVSIHKGVFTPKQAEQYKIQITKLGKKEKIEVRRTK